ncbi:MAG: penicillin-binding transpeptidase domain-containing protein, partial [Terriglobales bacterium]
RKRSTFSTVLILLAALVLLCAAATAATISPKSKKKSAKVSESAKTQKQIAARKSSHTTAKSSVKKASTKSRRRYSRYQWINGHRVKRNRYYERFTASSFVDIDLTTADVTAGEDPAVRAAAIEALGNMNGTVVAIDPNSGRILAMVNQGLALSEGAEPCSTIKLSVGLAALSEGIITKDTRVQLSRRVSMNLTNALAHSNNQFFEALGRRLGFEKVSYYAHQFGLGEMAGWNIPGEHLGVYPSEELDPRLGGVGRMCSFGESISMTPLQLGALVSAIANGGTLYYLQHPTSAAEVANFEPKVKRYLDIAPLIPEMQPGMTAAVEYGTAQSVRWNFNEEQILGKTGTCSNNGTRFGWFASYANTQYGKIAVVVFLEGGRPTFGPKAAELAGKMYRALYDSSYFAGKSPMANDRAGTAVGVSQ